MRYCKHCLFPETKPDIYFDDEGVCDACRSAERKHGVEKSIDWDARAKEFKDILDKYRSKDGTKYDCVVPVSGGKDSTFQVYAMKIIHKMNPLAVTFDQFDATDISKHNIDAMRSIGVDHIHFTLNPNIVRRLVKKGFEVVGDPYWVNHVGIYTVPTRVAAAFNIPLVVWGENPQLEYGGPAASRDNKVLDKRWRQEFGCMRGFREEDMVDNEISISDLKSLMWPYDEEIKRVGVTGLFYGYYFKWDTYTNMEISKKFGWKPLAKPWAGSWLDYENCDMKFLDIREHLKWVKYGYGRATDQVNIYIRNRQLTRKNGVTIVKKIDGKLDPKHVEEFCRYINMTKEEFYRVRDSFVNTDIFEKGKEWEWKLKEPLQ